MKMKLFFLLLLVIVTLNTVSCNDDRETNNLSGDQEFALQKDIITNYFDCINNEKSKDLIGVFTTRELMNSELIEKIELINISKEPENKQSNAYLNNGRGKITHPTEIMVLSVEYAIEYKEDYKNAITEGSGTKTKWFTLIKTAEEDNWLIDEIGY